MATRLDIRGMLLERQEPAQGEEVFDLSGRDFSGFSVPQPVRVSYTAAVKNGEVLLRLQFTAGLSAECARCLSPAVMDLPVNLEAHLREGDWQQPVPELPLDANGVLDLEELTYGEVVLEAPQVVLCSDECEGLCARCGQPKTVCQCPAEAEGDPRLAALKELLKN